ncbi:hypothetical protein IMG5_026670 [Ichthyophthirius multifiliis]|uniref:Guanylate cyclase domain-containing protein n=1 Tax=Ichthyophthirius multifiliis TaxID=5932 RepID=G0QL76_ICHMU|nr:hypothetical protein IMG5_026670 [Ichthyophthirius multifiliis]EGR34031.1 hypothetical protein IMG5_026670 [Ichthyophthirius multifiliis]|eukprot:XP_004039335.1 hypothetical protein IMG5_026670 [Ichthyophthirius multifiliis]
MNQNGNVNPLIPGKKILAIFGFVSIRNFPQITEILEENIMLFTNQIAEIIHIVCDSYHGIINKNLGDCFLIIWKLKDQDNLIQINKQEEISIFNISHCQNYTDLALIGFLKSQSNIYKLSMTKKFKNSLIKIQKTNPNFSLKLGFGLHFGWAIEGAIGSNFKIDASYLSPNVNLASRLENATKQYGIQLLVSGAVYRLLSNQTKQYLRHIDRVTVKGSEQPMDLYTCDMDCNLIEIQQLIKQSNENQNEPNKKILKYVQRMKKQTRLKKIIKNQIQVHNLFLKDNDFLIMRQTYTQEFFNYFHQGINNYLDGYWKDAKIKFEEAQLILNKEYEYIQKDKLIDGPINTLDKYMKNFNYQSPDNWKGYRELSEK